MNFHRKEEKLKWYKNKKILTSLVGIFIILIMVGSYLNVKDNSEQRLNYNGYNFVKTDKGWLAYIGNNAFLFSFTPSELEELNMPQFNLGSKIYVLFNPEERSEASYEVQRLSYILSYKGIKTFPACIKEEGCGNIPIMNCESQNNMMYLKSGNNKVYIDKNCLVFEGDKEYQARAIDRFSYSILGVM
ncbi:MAG: hypothetical protein AB1571_04195 [Nanoarchaeota archaeon]